MIWHLLQLPTKIKLIKWLSKLITPPLLLLPYHLSLQHHPSLLLTKYRRCLIFLPKNRTNNFSRWFVFYHFAMIWWVHEFLYSLHYCKKVTVCEMCYDLHSVCLEKVTMRKYIVYIEKVKCTQRIRIHHKLEVKFQKWDLIGFLKCVIIIMKPLIKIFYFL